MFDVASNTYCQNEHPARVKPFTTLTLTQQRPGLHAKTGHPFGEKPSRGYDGVFRSLKAQRALLSKAHLQKHTYSFAASTWPNLSIIVYFLVPQACSKKLRGKGHAVRDFWGNGGEGLCLPQVPARSSARRFPSTPLDTLCPEAQPPAPGQTLLQSSNPAQKNQVCQVAPAPTRKTKKKWRHSIKAICYSSRLQFPRLHQNAQLLSPAGPQDRIPKLDHKMTIVLTPQRS